MSRKEQNEKTQLGIILDPLFRPNRTLERRSIIEAESQSFSRNQINCSKLKLLLQIKRIRFNIPNPKIPFDMMKIEEKYRSSSKTIKPKEKKSFLVIQKIQKKPKVFRLKILAPKTVLGFKKL